MSPVFLPGRRSHSRPRPPTAAAPAAGARGFDRYCREIFRSCLPYSCLPPPNHTPLHRCSTWGGRLGVYARRRSRVEGSGLRRALHHQCLELESTPWILSRTGGKDCMVQITRIWMYSASAACVLWNEMIQLVSWYLFRRLLQPLVWHELVLLWNIRCLAAQAATCHGSGISITDACYFHFIYSI